MILPALEKCCNDSDIILIDNRDMDIESVIKCNNCKQRVSHYDGYELKELWDNETRKGMAKKLTKGLLDNCCNNPDIVFSKKSGEERIYCRNCYKIVVTTSRDRFLGRTVGEKWNLSPQQLRDEAKRCCPCCSIVIADQGITGLRMSCSSCKKEVFGYVLDEMLDCWNKDEDEQLLNEDDINEYPFVFAMR